MKRILAVLVICMFLAGGAIVAVPISCKSEMAPGPDYARGLHFGAYWPHLNTSWPGKAYIQIWEDDVTPPSVDNITEWAGHSNATHLVFVPYYGTLWSILGGTTAIGDEYVIGLADGLAKYNMKLVTMLICQDSRYSTFNSSVADCARHVAQIAITHTNIVMDFDEPDVWGTSQSLFQSYVNAVRNTNPDMLVMVGLDTVRGTPSMDKKWWQYCDGVLLIDYWASDTTALRSHVQTWRNSIDPEILWVWIDTGDTGVQVGGYNIGPEDTMLYLEEVINNAAGSFIFDGAGMWIYVGYKNPYDNGKLQKLLEDRYGQMMVPEFPLIIIPAAAMVILPFALLRRKRQKKTY
jgi:hypothetical protein